MSTVVIAGAGPTGLMLAAELALAGVHAVVLEPRSGGEEYSQGMAVHGRSLELLAQRGLAGRIGPEEMWAWPRTPFAFFWLDLATVDERDFTYALPQWRFEQMLQERADELGVEMRRGEEVCDATDDGDGVTVTVRRGGDEYQLRADYLVGCDGAGSTVRELAGIGFPGSGWSYSGLICDVALPDGDSPTFDSGIHEGGIFGALPLRPGMVRLMTIEFGSEPAADVPVTVGEVRDTVQRLTGSVPEIGDVLWLSRFGGVTRLAERYRKERIFLAGDAAHSLFISGTQAMNAGLHDAVNLGWKLAAVVGGRGPADLLSTYHEERHPVGAGICQHARAQIAMLHPLGRVSPLRELFTGLVELDEVNRLLLRSATGVRYPMTPGASEDGEPHPLLGERVPDVPLSTSAAGVTSTLEALHAGRGVLFDLSGGSHHPDAVRGGFRWSDRVDIVTAAPTPELGVTTLLVRPDGYVAHADPGGTDDLGLIRALRTWFGEPLGDLPAPVGRTAASSIPVR